MSGISIDDGMIIKTIKKAGSGESPPNGAKVTVHYVGTLLNGEKFDSSRDRSDPFTFSIGQGSVIKGWDVGVATMQPGEIADLEIKSEYAYGARGSPPKIPANATLRFEVELISWTDKEEVTPDGGVQKKTVKKGAAYQSPSERASIKATVTGWVVGNEGKENVQFVEVKEETFTFDDPEWMCEGLEQGMLKMTLGEVATFFVSPAYGWGSKGHEALNIPADANLMYTVDLTSFDNGKESWDMDTKDKIAAAETLKAAGNKHFGRQSFARAVSRYLAANSMIENETGEGEAATTLQKLIESINGNLAACHLKQKNYKEVVNFCDKVLQSDSKNVKAFSRKGKALLFLKRFPEAHVVLKKVVELDPTDANAKKLIKYAIKQMEALKKKERQMYSGMFGGNRS